MSFEAPGPEPFAVSPDGLRQLYGDVEEQFQTLLRISADIHETCRRMQGAHWRQRDQLRSQWAAHSAHWARVQHGFDQAMRAYEQALGIRDRRLKLARASQGIDRGLAAAS